MIAVDILIWLGIAGMCLCVYWAGKP